MRTNRLLASFYIASSRAAEAEPYLKVVVENSQEIGARLVLADYYVLTQRPAEAIEILESAATGENALPEVQWRLARVEYAKGNTQEAHSIIDSIIRDEPGSSQALLLKGRFLLAEDQLDDALTSVMQAVEARPDFAEAHYMVGVIRSARHEIDAAISSFNKVVEVNPLAVDAQLELSRLHLAQGATDTSVQYALAAVRAQPGNPAARVHLARGLMARGDLAGAEAELDQLNQAYPDAASVHSQLGLLALRKSDHRAARHSFDRALELDGNLLEPLAGLVFVDVSAGDPTGARVRVEEHLAGKPNDPDLLLLAATVHLASRDYAQAERTLRRVLAVDSSKLQAYGMLGQIYLSQERLEEARTEFETLANRSPLMIAPHTMVAMILEFQGKSAEAQRRYEQIMEIDPRAAVAANNLAWIYAENGGNLDIALQLARTAVGQLPDHAAVNDTLGWIYYRKNLATLAIGPLQTSVEREPENPVFHYHLGLAYARTGGG